MKKIKFSLIALAILAFVTTLVAVGIHYEFHIPWSIKLFAGSFGILFAMFIIVGILGKFGFYLPRHGPPPKNMNFLFLTCGILTLASCNQTQPKQFCSELSKDCELSKNFVMLKVIQNNGSALDVYGRPLEQKKWYMYATQPGTIIDFEWNDNAKCVTPRDLDVLVSGEVPSSILYKCKKIKIDTITNFSVYVNNPKQVSSAAQVITKVALLQTNGYFDIFNDGRGIKVTYIEQKEITKNPATK
jgi:hypothetical protein